MIFVVSFDIRIHYSIHKTRILYYVNTKPACEKNRQAGTACMYVCV